jgi:hypothetical protein
MNPSRDDDPTPQLPASPSLSEMEEDEETVPAPLLSRLFLVLFPFAVILLLFGLERWVRG